jgi:hypothetical protein
MQAHGTAFRARAASFRADAEQVCFEADIAGAYPESAGLLRWQRRCTLARAQAEVRISDRYEFAREHNSYELRFMTCVRPRPIERGVEFRLTGGETLNLTVRSAPLETTLHEFAIHDRQLQRAWGKTLYQVRLWQADAAQRGECVLTLSRGGPRPGAGPEAPLPVEDLP